MRVSNYWQAEEALNGTPEKFRPCKPCRGTGFTDEYEAEECWNCGGEGEVPVL